MQKGSALACFAHSQLALGTCAKQEELSHLAVEVREGTVSFGLLTLHMVVADKEGLVDSDYLAGRLVGVDSTVAIADAIAGKLRIEPKWE